MQNLFDVVWREGLHASVNVIGCTRSVGSEVNDAGCSPCKPSQTCFLQLVQQHYRGLPQITKAVQGPLEAHETV
jgi:hypothetical protein